MAQESCFSLASAKEAYVMTERHILIFISGTKVEYSGEPLKES